MNVSVQYANNNLSLNLESGETAALYAVPVSYSEDGLYLAQWAQNELEPVPACDGAELLLKLGAASDNGAGVILNEIFRSEGVNYAKN